MRFLWLIGGFISLALGFVGAFLPILPTVPFLLLAAFSFARSSERLQHWLLTHPRLGPPILDWQERGRIGRRTKVAASLSILAAFALSLAFGLKPFYLAVQAIALLLVAIFIWTRPER